MINNKANIKTISTRWNILFNFIFSIWSILCIGPVLLVLSVSLTDEDAIYNYGYSFIPQKFSFKAYEYIFKSGASILGAYGVTIFATVIGTILSVVVISLYGYASSRKNLKYRGFFTFFAAFTMLFNGGLVPTYIVVSNYLHLKDKIWVLIFPLLFNAFYMIVVRTFFATNIHESILESARIDGSGELRTFIRIVIPLSVPALATIALFSTFGYWNDYMQPLLYINNPKYYNLQFMMYTLLTNLQFLQNFSSQSAELSKAAQSVPKEGVRMALAILTIGPIILAYPFFQRFFIKGLTIGAVKG